MREHLVHAEMMEKLCDGVDVKSGHLYERSGKNYIFNSIFILFLKLEKNLKPYLESSFHVDFKNGITIEFSCRNNGEMWS